MGRRSLVLLCIVVCGWSATASAEPAATDNEVVKTPHDAIVIARRHCGYEKIGQESDWTARRTGHTWRAWIDMDRKSEPGSPLFQGPWVDVDAHTGAVPYCYAVTD